MVRPQQPILCRPESWVTCGILLRPICGAFTRRLQWHQGLPSDQPVTVLTDGGDSVRALVGDLPAGSEHHLDWFHVAMRMTVLGQYAKGLAHYNPLEATALQDRLERVKWRLWHGNADEALARARALAEDVAALASGYPGLTRLVKSLSQ